MIRKQLLQGILAAAVGLMPAITMADGVGTYLTDRGNDILDIFRVRVGTADGGRGIGLKGRVTSVAQAGYVYFEGTYAGLDRRGFGIVDERRHEGGVSLLYGSFNEMEPRIGNGFLLSNTDWSDVEDRRILRNLPHWDDGRLRPLSLGLEVATPLLAVDLGLYPEELADFIVGIVTLDLFRDDQLRMEVPTNMNGTADPGPDGNAPFAEKRAENKRILQEIADRKAAEVEAQLREAGLLAPTEAPAEPVEREVEADVAPVVVEPEAAAEPLPGSTAEELTQPGVITPENAEAVIRKLEELERQKAAEAEAQKKAEEEKVIPIPADPTPEETPAEEAPAEEAPAEEAPAEAAPTEEAAPETP